MSALAWGRLTIAATAVGLVALAVGGSFVLFSPTTVVMIVRHAERAAEPRDDPPLTTEGNTRARMLVHVAGQAGVSAIFATEFVRTQQTVAPLATQLNIGVTAIPQADVNGLVAQIRALRGATILVAGHTHTIPDIIVGLGGPAPGTITEPEFDNFFVVILPRFGSARVVRLRYGEPPPPPP